MKQAIVALAILAGIVLAVDYHNPEPVAQNMLDAMWSVSYGFFNHLVTGR